MPAKRYLPLVRLYQNNKRNNWTNWWTNWGLIGDVVSIYALLFLFLHPLNRTNNTRSIDSQMTCDLRSRRSQFFPASIGYDSTSLTYTTSLSSGFQLTLTYQPVTAFRINDLQDGKILGQHFPYCSDIFLLSFPWH